MTRRERHARLFNRIAAPYAWFFSRQVRAYAACFDLGRSALPDPRGRTALDIGCGTGAFTAALRREGWDARGVDVAEAMAGRARRRGLECAVGDALEGLDFPARSFDLVSAAYVAHGLGRDDRLALFREMKRLARDTVLVHDYNAHRTLAATIVEALEGGDYVNFIATGAEDLRAVVSSVRVVPVGRQSAWYVGRP